MRPANLKSRIFLDSGDSQDTRQVLKLLGFLEGQTTNPSLIAKNPRTTGKKFDKKEFLDFYKKVVQEISGLIPQGSVSIEVYADANTKAEEMLEQARRFFRWISPHPFSKGGGAHIKFPTTIEGLRAAEQAVKEGIQVNMTLCFSQEQAAAVHAATRGAKKGDVFVSPFVGRLDDHKERGMDLIKNIIQMYQAGDGHVEVLTASVRNLDYLFYAIKLGSDIITAPLKVLQEWVSSNFPPQAWGGIKGEVEPLQNWQPISEGLRPISYKELDLSKPWREFDIKHELTDIGMEKFSEDWNKLIK